MSSFCLNDYHCIAFDMDHTLIQYNLPELSRLIYTCLVEYLKDTKQYPPHILEMSTLEKHRDLCMRGIIFDYRKGNLLKLDLNGYILICCHGFHKMVDEEIKAEYGGSRTWPSFPSLKETLSGNAGYAVFDNFYTLPAIPLITSLIDHVDTKNGEGSRLSTYAQIWKHLAEAFNLNFNYTSFKGEKGIFMPALRRHPEKYVKKWSPRMREWVQSLRESKTTALITYTFANLAEHLMTYVVGEDWKQCFDFIIGYAKKPSFFEESYKDIPFYTMTDEEELSSDVITSLKKHELFMCGSSRRLAQEVQRLTRHVTDTQPKFVYFGDSIRSDVWAPAFHTDWDTVAILEELQWEHDLVTPVNHAAKFLPAKKAKVENEVGLSEKFLTSEYWGSLLYHHDITTTADSSDNGIITTDLGGSLNHKSSPKGRNQLNTFWGEVIGTYSKIAIPLVECLVDLPLDYTFKTFDDEQLGFYS